MNIAPNETTDTTLRLTERFKAAYHTLGLPQRTVARILRLKRAQIDDYQQGIAIPLEREVAELEHRVTERSRALQAIDAASNSFSLSSQMPSPQLTMEEMFSSYLKRWVVAWDEWRVRYPSEANRADLFFFSPECLSISDLAFGDRVAAHLEQFVDHHFFWIVDGYTIEKLWGEVMALKRIEARIVNDPSSMASGKIHFYPITIGNSEKELSEFYDKLRSSQDNRGRLTLHPLIDIASQPKWLQVVLLSGEVPLVIARLCVDIELLKHPVEMIPLGNFAARRHENVSLNPLGTKASGWIYLDYWSVLKLVSFLNDVVPIPLS